MIYDVCGVSYCNLASLYEWLGKVDGSHATNGPRYQMNEDEKA